MLKALAILALACLRPLPAADNADAALARMDREAPSFRDMTANIKKSTFTAVLNETSEERGAIWMKRSGKRVQMRVEIAEPEPRSVGLEGNTGQIYYPKIQTVQVYDLGKNSALIDQFSLLGFGTSRKDVEANYGVKAAGEDTVGGQRALRLVLTPKSPKVLEQVKSVELWFPPNAGHPVQQRFVQPSGDFHLVTYSELKLNPSLPDSEFKLKLPKSVKKEYPGK